MREIEQELLDGTISLAVHSMKDMPAEQPSGLVFAHAWKREDPRDVLILREAVSLEELPQHAVIGTGSRRRAFQLLQLRKDLRITGIRGNVDTRIKKDAGRTTGRNCTRGGGTAPAGENFFDHAVFLSRNR